jgi:hypothetical protein
MFRAYKKYYKWRKRKRKVKKIYGDLIKNERGENVFIIVIF